jgi:hypothetical protein
LTVLIWGAIAMAGFWAGYWFRSLGDEKWPDNNARPDQTWGW